MNVYVPGVDSVHGLDGHKGFGSDDVLVSELQLARTTVAAITAITCLMRILPHFQGVELEVGQIGDPATTKRVLLSIQRILTEEHGL